jgi:hypothetical protein
MGKEPLALTGAIVLAALATLPLPAPAQAHRAQRSSKPQLTVKRTGTGTGTITSQPSGISCGSTCQARFAKGTAVKLKAAPKTGSVFGGWSGCDSTSGAACTVKMGKDRQVTATFVRQYNLTVTKSGSGKVTSTPAGINCGTTCKAHFDSGKSVTLTPTATSTSTFGAWKGCTTVSGKSCIVKMSADRSVSATFPRKKVPLHFHLKGAVGLALRGAGQSQPSVRRAATDAGSNLEAVDASGQTSDAVDSGSATASRFWIAPNGDVYMEFDPAVNLSDTGVDGSCVLARVNPDTGTPVCIASGVDIRSPEGYNAGAANPAIQFDGSGAVYYFGGNVLKKYQNGTTTDLITTNNIHLTDFLVLSDGSVLITGETLSPYSTWTRRVTQAGGLQSLSTYQSAFLRAFPDGNAYIGVDGVRRYLAATTKLDPKYWIGGSDAYFDAGSFCEGAEGDARIGFCSYGGGLVKSDTFETTDGRLYMVAGSVDGTLTQYYPTVSFPTTAVQSISLAEAAGTKIVITGLNADGEHLTTLYDPATDTETPLIGSNKEIEVYHLSYSADQNVVLFDGLRFADNRYVLGKIDLATSQVTVLSTTGEKLDDFQALG